MVDINQLQRPSRGRYIAPDWNHRGGGLIQDRMVAVPKTLCHWYYGVIGEGNQVNASDLFWRYYHASRELYTDWLRAPFQPQMGEQ